jgi:N-acetylmuramoyl-L-alanine amidase
MGFLGMMKAPALPPPQYRAMEAGVKRFRAARLALVLLALACGAPELGAAPPAENVVSDMRIVGDAQKTRFVVDLAANPEFSVLRLASPYRLVIDMPDVRFDEAVKIGKGRGLISDYRFGLFAPGKARIVLDLTGPVEIAKTFVLDPVDPEPARLVIDIAPTTVQAFEAAVQQQAAEHAALAPREPSPEIEHTGQSVVVIDPGHGGIDSGAVGEDGLLEKDVTLKFGRELARQIELGGALDAVLTRDGDEFVALRDRIDVARRHKAVLFVSIHADSVPQDYVRGATVYTVSEEATDSLAAALATRENRADILAGLSIDDEPDEVADILLDLARRETMSLSVSFAKGLVEDIDGVMPLNSNPRRRADFVVLRAPDVPSVLLELGYLSNPEDEALFHAADWPGAPARRVARAIEEFVEGDSVAGQ